MNDMNDPLNWSRWRKFINWTLVLSVTAAAFTGLSIQTNFWQQMTVEMDLTYEQLNNSMSANGAGCALGCVVFIPIAQKYGRRSVYIISTALMAASSWWTSRMTTLPELYLTNLLFGLAGSVNETLAQMTLADLFFIHQRGTINATYLTAVIVGSFLTPIPAGAQALHQGWRWSYYALSISLTILSVLFVVAYEETKYVPAIEGVREGEQDDLFLKADMMTKGANLARSRSVPEQQQPVPLKAYSERLAWLTTTGESLWNLFYFPFLASGLPHVAFASLQYASGVTWLVIQASILSMTFSAPPYNFTTASLGYLGLGPFIGNLLGSFYGGILGDWAVRVFSRRNGGYYEPEYRLYHLLLPCFAQAGGLVMFGATIARGMHWIYPSIGGGLFAFGLGAIGDAVFTMVLDTYEGLAGSCFIVIAFFRNVVSIGIPFAIVPWMDSQGLTNMHIVMACVSLFISLLHVPMIFRGKKLRVHYAARYSELLGKQMRHGQGGRA
ncbi:hypothetical protein FALCPG4_016102 [Fusarium falciforme]